MLTVGVMPDGHRLRRRRILQTEKAHAKVPGICQEIISVPCPLPLNEVCGCDGVTYQSECVARSAGARIAFEGGCP